MKSSVHYGLKSIIATTILILGLGTTNVYSQGLAIDTNPLFLTNGVDPRVMLVMSRDHQLYIKAYTDYSDLNDDGEIDKTFNNIISYSGYFDSKKCYTYSNNSRFEPSRLAPTESVSYNGQTYTVSKCGNNGEWSGNFLNWATMTRMDLVRKVLYGGYRSTDDTITVLERVLLPYDVHSFVKVFETSTTEMRKYTPYSETKISICNLTQGSGLARDVTTSSTPPIIRVAKNGPWPRWAASEVTQCQWGSGTQPSNANNLVNANSNDGLNVRVKVCVSDGAERRGGLSPIPQ